MDIISKLEKGKILTAEQLLRMDAGGLRSGGGGKKNVLRVMREMEADGLVSSKRVGTKLFGEVGSRFGFWEHTLMRNDFLIDKGWFDVCQMEMPIRRNGGGGVVVRCDAGVNIMGQWHFIEVDRRQEKRANIQKIEKYKELEDGGVDFELWIICYSERKRFWDSILGTLNKTHLGVC